MKKYAVFVLCILTLIFVTLTSAGVGTAKAKKSRAHAGGSPTVVPGTELHGNVAKVKPGYRFVQRENGVGVINIRTNANMGTYTCPCKTDPNRKCELIFSPTYITCKNGSCGASVTSCVLLGSVPTMRQ